MKRSSPSSSRKAKNQSKCQWFLIPFIILFSEFNRFELEAEHILYPAEKRCDVSKARNLESVYSQLSPYGHIAITDTPLLRTLCKSPAKPIINYIAEALAITDSRYYGIADTLCGPQQTFLFISQRESKVAF